MESDYAFVWSLRLAPLAHNAIQLRKHMQIDQTKANDQQFRNTCATFREKFCKVRKHNQILRIQHNREKHCNYRKHNQLQKSAVFLVFDCVFSLFSLSSCKCCTRVDKLVKIFSSFAFCLSIWFLGCSILSSRGSVIGLVWVTKVEVHYCVYSCSITCVNTSKCTCPIACASVYLL